MTAVPLGQLRRGCGEWRTNRWYRPPGVAPFLLSALHDVWPGHADFLRETFGVPHIYCLLSRLSGHLTGTPGQVL